MIQLKTLSAIIFLLFLAYTNGVSQTTDDILSKAIELRASFKEQEALDLFDQVLAADPNNFEATWSKSILLARLGYRMDNKDKQAEYYRNAKTFAEKALALDSLNLNSNFAMAVAMGRMALISGAKERVAASKDIKFYGDRALAADSNHAGAWHVLGRWHHKVANLNFAERTAANLLFGGAPKGASNDMAIYCMKKAISLEPNLILYQRDYANILEDLDMEKEALKVAQHVQTMPDRTLDDPKFKKEMQKLIKDLD
ncbi:hypothetical protein EP331_03045 [bacterium]|nr:MAG: hypothetical protein EP331_03045 [bacterium]